MKFIGVSTFYLRLIAACPCPLRRCRRRFQHKTKHSLTNDNELQLNCVGFDN